MFERDLPGENKSGLSFQKASAEVPLETCETINGAWGYNITDRHYKTVNQVIQLLVGAAGRNANLLLNVGPMPNGVIQPEFTDTLAAAGKWLKQYGETIYGTRGGPTTAQPWGVTTQKEKKVYIHLFKKPEGDAIFLPGSTMKIKGAKMFDGGEAIRYKQQEDGISISIKEISVKGPDTIIVVELK
jgi:alpha-L-fucosidase